MKFTIVALASILLTASPAAAHEVEKGPNGGRVVEASAHHVQLRGKSPRVRGFADFYQRFFGETPSQKTSERVARMKVMLRRPDGVLFLSSQTFATKSAKS